MVRLTHWLVVLTLLGPRLARSAQAQAEYRNLDAGFPVRVEDATVTERYAFDLDLANFRFDALSGNRKRLQLEPQFSYGILPYTEMWLRVPLYYRESTITPRKGIAGVGVGAMYQWSFESLNLPALAFASEAFFPTGPGALPASYSFKTLFTKSVSTTRIHLNASLASFAIRSAVDCRVLPGGSVCGGQGGPSLPPIDGPCMIGSESAVPVSFSCAVPAPAPAANETELAQATTDRLVTHAHWLVGMAVDKTLPLRSIVFVADAFAERFEGIGRSTDLTAELGARKQVSPGTVLVGGVGRHFRGANQSTFIVLGATYSRALQGFWRRI
jgi:hypothetical protein